MRIKFNKFERVAGLFVLAAIVGTVGATFSIAVKKGWFASKVQFETTIESADGIHTGTAVQIAGLRAGAVTNVELISAKEVLVKFEVFEKFQSRVREDSHVQMLRPFVIGDKVLDVSVGSEDSKSVLAGASIPSKPTIDMMDLVSGRKLGPLLGTLEGLMGNMKILADAFADTKRTEAFVNMFDEMTPLMKNFNKMALQVTKMTRQINKIAPDAVKNAPELATQIQLLVGHLNILTKNLAPAVAKVGPRLPEASLRALEALDEAVVVLKAMQKSFILRGKVEDVREEESARQRQPAREGK